MDKKQTKKTFGIISGIIFVIFIVKTRFIGFYPSEWPLLVGIILAAFICATISAKIKVDEEEEA
jgi:uncharacterized membrane protein